MTKLGLGGYWHQTVSTLQASKPSCKRACLFVYVRFVVVCHSFVCFVRLRSSLFVFVRVRFCLCFGWLVCSSCCLVSHLVVWSSSGRLVGWSGGRVVVCSSGRLVVWSFGRVVGGLIGRLVVCSSGFNCDPDLRLHCDASTFSSASPGPLA